MFVVLLSYVCRKNEYMSFYTKEDKQIISEKLQKLGIDKYDKNKYKTETT